MLPTAHANDAITEQGLAAGMTGGVRILRDSHLFFEQ